MQSAVDHVFIWFDEKIFTVEAVTNTQNDGLYAREAGICLKVVLPNYAIWNQLEWWWPAIASDGSMFPLVFIEEGFKVNTQVYMRKLIAKVIPWITSNFGNGHIFTQDGARPTHWICLNSGGCKDHFSGIWNKNMWPSLNPDINPADFAIWSILESDISAESYSNVASGKKTSCFMVCFRWSSKAFMPFSYPSFGAYSQGNRSIWNLIAVIY